MYIALALLSSLALGSADFVGGAAAKRASATVVVVWSHAAGLLVGVMLAVPGIAAPADLAWGATAGLSGSITTGHPRNGHFRLQASLPACGAAAVPPGPGQRGTGVSAETPAP